MDPIRKMRSAYNHATPAVAFGKKEDVIHQGFSNTPEEGTYQMVVECKPAGTYFYTKFVRRESSGDASVGKRVSSEEVETVEQIASVNQRVE